MAKVKSEGTPLMRQYLDVKSKYEDCIVLFRMGDFFETFNEDAKLTAKILGIVLTKRSNGAAADTPLAGFPHHSLDNYLPKLVNAGYKVAICEQVEDPKLAKGIVKREVVEVVTPGTLSTDHDLGQKTNQFIACIAPGKTVTGYAVLDQSTGDFFMGESHPDFITDALRRFNPREIIISDEITYSLTNWYRELRPFVSQVEGWYFDPERGYRTLIDHFKTNSLKGFGCDDMRDGIAAAGVVLTYIREQLNGKLDHVTLIRPVRHEGLMGLDGFTIRNLEVFHSLSTQGTHGTLIDNLDETSTAGGGRLLRRWLYQPITDLKELQTRQHVVKAFYDNKSILDSTQSFLKDVPDIERIIGKVSKFKVSPRELAVLGDVLLQIPDFSKSLESHKIKSLKTLSKQFVSNKKIATEISKKLHENCPAQLKQGYVIAAGIHPQLDELRELASGGKKWLEELKISERARTGIPSLKISYNRVFGYYIDITKTHQDRVPEEYIRKQTLVNSERYITPELKEYEEKILTAEGEIERIEAELFAELCMAVLQESHNIQTNARILNRIDVLLSFAYQAIRDQYVCPVLTEKRVLDIKDGRHPVVEKLLSATERFVPNHVVMDAETNQIHLITGPNMAGKSTYLRQIGLLVLMAQIGSFIPAKEATIGIVDHLFTRVGASDNLAGGESTFLVEMNEAANILNNATAHSLILLDEIGRGTATYDGLSLAWAITEYIHETEAVQARTLFATHYHELTDLEHTLERLENHHVAVKEFGDKIVFLRKILPGAGDKSYGIHVAQMAGLPESIIHRATEILDYHLNQTEEKPGTFPEYSSSNQINIFEEQTSKLKEELKSLNINDMTPIEALNQLHELKKKHGV